MTFFSDNTDCRPGGLTKATVGKSIETFFRTIAEGQGFDPADNLPVASVVNISASRADNKAARVRVSWAAELTPPSTGSLSEEDYEIALAALLSALEGA